MRFFYLRHFCRYFFYITLFATFCSKAKAQLTADFTASVVSGCSPLTVQFKDNSTGGPTSWYWDLGNGMNSTSPSPSTTYTNAGSYNVRLIIRNASGQNYVLKTGFIIVNPTPDVSFASSVVSGCLPLAVKFTNTSTLFGANVQTWAWDFGDGGSANSQDASHTYTTRNSFNISLIGKTDAGCVDTFSLNSGIRAGNKPVNVSFNATPLNGCASVLRKFTDLSTGTINSWRWNFGDGSFDNSKAPLYHYQKTGIFPVKLIVADNGCADSVQYDNYMEVDGPLANIYVQTNCSQPYDLNIFTLYRAAESWLWDFGDGTTSSEQSQNHIYSKPGKYVVRLSDIEGGCVDSTSDTVYVVDQHPSYTVKPLKSSYCKYDSIEFIASNYDNNFTSGFAWSFDNGITRTAYSTDYVDIKYSYTSNGNSAPILYVKNKQLCIDTIQKAPITINGPIASFNSTTPACFGDTLNFVDLSASTSNIVERHWDYDDGDSAISGSPQANYKFPFTGLYNVFLKVTDSNGCFDTISHEINVAEKPIISAGLDTFLCEGKSVTLQPLGGFSYVWDSSPYLNCTDCANPNASPTDTTIFYVTGRNEDGCSARDSLVIYVKQKKQVSVNPPVDTVCVGNSVQLNASGYDNFSWTPTSGLNNPAIAKPVATPVANTTYTVTSTDNSGCFSQTANANVLVYPIPQVNIIDTAVTIAPGISYQIKANYSADVIKWEWLPSQWLSNANASTPVASPLQTVTYTVAASTAAGCEATGHITINVLCNNTIIFIPNTFSPNGDGMNDYFYPRSRASIKIKSLQIFNRWGQVVFKNQDFFTNDQVSGWNGKYKGVSQQADVYPYVVTFLCANGSTFFEKGNLTLLR